MVFSWRCGFCKSVGMCSVQLLLLVLLYGLIITLLCILKGLTFLLPALELLMKLRDHNILDIRNTEEEGRLAKHCLEIKNLRTAVKFEKKKKKCFVALLIQMVILKLSIYHHYVICTLQ